MENTDVRKKLKEMQQDMLKTYYFVPNERLFAYMSLAENISKKFFFKPIVCSKQSMLLAVLLWL